MAEYHEYNLQGDHNFVHGGRRGGRGHRGYWNGGRGGRGHRGYWNGGHGHHGGHDGHGGNGGHVNRGGRGGHANCGGHGDQGGRMQYLSDEELQILSQGSHDDVLVIVNENESKFLNTFKRQHFCNHPLKLKQMIKLLYLLARCEDKSTASRMLVYILCADGEYALFTTKIDMLKGMALEERNHIRRENPSCIDQLIDIGLMAIKTIPSTVVMTYPVSVIDQTIKDLQEMGETMELLAAKSAELSTAFRQEKMKTFQQRMQKQKSKLSKDSEGEPPEPFTDLSILPSHNEMHMDPKKVFLRSNKVNGPYTNWEHYFDVQFRLLREDFVRPLRRGIEVYSSTGFSQRTSDIRVYEGARVLNPVCLFTGIGFQLRFDSNKFRNVNWEHSRRLIFGSLLCLSNDDFDQCLLFATVVKRDPKFLKEGLITIKFENDVNGFQIDPKESYTMVESTAYYEAYRHILEGLQELSTIPDAMPMEKYIVTCGDEKHAKVPQFLRIPSHPPRFNMADVLENKVPGRHSLLRRKIFDIIDHSLWPPAEVTHLDSSQLRALEMALTKEVSVIQGPPGTGKTYIGHKIVEAYLKNRDVWDPQKTAPILVVCYTNHALDQFLEGIHKLSIGLEGDHPNIIRVGGRCKSEELGNFVLSKKVQECRTNRNLPRPIFKELMESRNALFDCQRYINSRMESCDAESKQKIASVSNLMPVMEPLHVEQLLYGKETTQNKEMEVWLNLWFPETFDQDDMQYQPSQLQRVPQAAAIPEDEDNSSSDDELINVDNEARVLEDERMIAGEELEIPNKQQAKKGANITGIQPKRVRDKHGWTTVQHNPGQIKKQISQGFSNKPMTDGEVSRVHNIWRISLKQRWMLYLYWTNKYIRLCKERINAKAEEYNAICTIYGRSQKKVDCFVAQSADVIGMTTTGAAKYHHLLKEIHPKIVIFEEAAEILEAHVVTSLASSVQQLVMIGDHKQLRPKPTCYDLEKDYSLAVSLFERLIKNGFEHVTLEKQHRMRPEISKLVCDSIYEGKLLDAENVKMYDHVRGVSKDVFFINHTQPEEPNDYNDTKSHVNKFEAEYIVELCHYLLKQDYSPLDITILTMYRGQLLELRKRMKREHFEGVRVAAVDDFQGEENEIILLSLVRSNSDKSIGFLKIENRVCVSLSRAKKGLYVIGNLSMLRAEQDTKWPEIIHHLEKENCVGYGLPLYCPVHPDDKLSARLPTDFKKRPEGGCTKLCGTRLACGHACERICHPRDREHKASNCSKKCGKSLPCGHNCTRKCYQCKKKSTCEPCSELVKKTLPSCGHMVTLACSLNSLLASCPLQCERLLPCGHRCQNTCSVACTAHCKIKMKKQLPCGHEVEVCCYENPDSVICPVKCDAMLACGDKCGGACGKCQRGRLHIKCLEKCGRELVCGHHCKYPCASICPPCEEKCGNYCNHSKCPKKCYEPCDPCMEPCQWRCPHYSCTKPCGQLCNRPPCDRPCTKLLKCGHQCIGLCGERCPKKCRICNKDEVCEILFGEEDENDALFIELQDCGHIIEYKALDNWIKPDTSKADRGNASQVQFKACPKCKTSIRKSLRYGNVIKEALNDVEAIKRKQAETSGDLYSKYREAEQKLVEQGHSSYVQEDMETLRQRLQIQRDASNWYRATAMKFQLSVLPNISKLKNLLRKLKSLSGVSIAGCTPEYLKESLSVLKKVIMQDILSNQQITDCTFELRRLNCAAKLQDLLCKLHEKNCAVITSDKNVLLGELKQVHLGGWKLEKLTEEKETKIRKIIENMSTRYKVDGLSQKERQEIVNAVGLSKGHWFKCPKGHYYCIGECGGAMEHSKCPECGSMIGGQNHTLASGNVHAGEMDGSHNAAWSDAANNMANFDPADLARLRL